MAIYLLPVCVNSMNICLNDRGIAYFFCSESDQAYIAQGNLC